jgi:sulfate adenylyltransferase
MTATRPLPALSYGSALGRTVAPTRRSQTGPRWVLSRRQLCDFELLACGAFAPLTTFLSASDYESVCESMRLGSGQLWPMPITLDVDEATLRRAESAGRLTLCDPEGVPLAALRVDEAWRPDLRAEALAVFGTDDVRHPGVDHLLSRTHPWYVAGRLDVCQLPEHADYSDLRRTPAQLKEEFAMRGWHRVVAFQTRNPMHRAHHELTVRAVRSADAKLLIHPVVGIGQPGDVDLRTRVLCYNALLPRYAPGTAILSLLPLAMRMAGPREALWHALIRRNYGATHFIVGRDHAGPKPPAGRTPFYQPLAAQELVRAHEDELGISVLTFPPIVHCASKGLCLATEVPAGEEVQTLSGTQLRQRLADGADVPGWFTVPEVADQLRRRYPPRSQRGFTVFLTGLSGAGKSTIARVLVERLREVDDREATVLDGDHVRQHLSSGLGYSREDRDRNVLRVGWVAAEITRHRGVSICAPIAPYDATRRHVRRMVEEHGGFVLVHVATSLETCERRDRKGLYAGARAGLIDRFTGISDPYEPPSDADVVIDTELHSPRSAAEAVLEKLRAAGYIARG